MKRYIAITALLATTAFASCDSVSKDETVNLQFNLQNGKQYVYEMVTEQTTTTDVQGMSVEMKQDMSTTATYNVLSKEGDATRVEVIYNRIKMKTSGAGMQSEFDTDNPTGNEPVYANLSKMVKKPFEMTINKNGEIMAMTGADKMLEGVLDSSMGDINGMTDSMLRSMMQQSLTVYPGQPVKPGDQWVRSYTTNIGFMKLNFKNNYTLKSVKKGIAHIDVMADISMSRPEDSSETMLDMEITGTQNGTIDMEVATGLIKESKLEQQIKGKVSMPNLEVEAPISAKSLVTITGNESK